MIYNVIFFSSSILTIYYIFHKSFNRMKSESILIKPFHFYTRVADDFENECFNFIDNEQNNNNIEDCYVHSAYRYLLCCHLGVPPSQSKIGRILVLGSAGKIGLSLTKILNQNNILFAEIRGKLHFDLRLNSIYEIFDTLNITHVFDLVRSNENESLHEQIFKYFNKRGIVVTRVVENQVNSKYDQIISPQIFGNQFLKIGVSQLFNDTFHCIVKNECNRKHIYSNDLYIPVNEITNELLKAITHKTPQIRKPKVSVFTEKEIWEKVILYKQNKLNKDDKVYPVFEDIYEEEIERKKKPYLTIGYLTSNDKVRYSKAENTIKMYEKILNEYPDINLEMIVLWVKNNDNATFEECMNVGQILKKRLHVYEISQESIQLVLKILKTNYMPEYFFRDVAVRLGSGELLMTGSSDVYPSPLFFEIAQRKLIGPFTILKSLRINAPSFNDSFGMYLKKDEPVASSLDQATKPTSFWKYYNFVQGALGDIQGALRQTMYKMNGWLFDKWVFAADTIFAWDLTMFKVPFYSVSINNSMHQFHVPTSKHSPRFNTKNKPFSRRKNLCKGIPTKNMNENVRSNWGISFDFQVDNKHCHLVYDVLNENDDHLNYHLYKLQFKIIYNMSNVS